MKPIRHFVHESMAHKYNRPAPFPGKYPTRWKMWIYTLRPIPPGGLDKRLFSYLGKPSPLVFKKFLLELERHLKAGRKISASFMETDRKTIIWERVGIVEDLQRWIGGEARIYQELWKVYHFWAPAKIGPAWVLAPWVTENMLVRGEKLRFYRLKAVGDRDWRAEYREHDPWQRHPEAPGGVIEWR